MLKDFNDVIGALKEDFAESMENVSTKEVEKVAEPVKSPKVIELDGTAERVKVIKPEKVVKQIDVKEVAKSQSGLSIFLSFMLQLSAIGLILAILSTFTLNSMISNLDILKETYKSTMQFDGYSLIMCESIESFVSDAIASVSNYDYGKVYFKMGIDFVITVFGLFIAYRASKTSNSVSLAFQRVILALSVIVALGIQGYVIRDNFAFMPNVSINNYFTTMSYDQLQDLAMEMNGVTVQLRSDGTAHGVYKANKENMLNTLISSTSNWGVDFELPKQLSILDAEFKLKGVTESEFIYELPDVMYVDELSEMEGWIESDSPSEVFAD